MKSERVLGDCLKTASIWVAAFIGLLCVPRADGQVVNDPTKAATNTVWLQHQADNGDIVLPDGTLYISKRIRMPTTIGSRITSRGVGTGYWYPADNPSRIAAKPARICQLTPGEPIFVLTGAGTCMDSVTLEGTGDQALIEIEGRLAPVATGQHRFRNLLFYNALAWFRALGGYYGPDGKFVSDENHADNCTVTDCLGSNCQRIFWSQNQQAVNWYFRAVGAGWDQNATPLKPVTLFDIERGGKVHVDGIEICCPQTTLFRVRDFSPNNCWVTCHNLSLDRLDTREAYLTLLAYAGPPSDANWQPWVFGFSGFVSQELPAAKLYSGPADWPRNHWKVDLQTIYKFR